MQGGYKVTLSVTPTTLRVPVRWAVGPEEVPPWELGWGTDALYDIDSEAVLEAQIEWRNHQGGPKFQNALERVRAELGPPPERWFYPRLVIAAPPDLNTALFYSLWFDLPDPISPLSGLLRVGKAAYKDLKSKTGMALLSFKNNEWRKSRTAREILWVAPRIGLLDPFRTDFTPNSIHLLPELPVEREEKVVFFPSPLEESLFGWVVAGLTVLVLTQALWVAKRRGRVEEALELLDGVPSRALPEVWAYWEYSEFAATPPYFLPLSSYLGCFLREISKGGILTPSHLQKALLDWGLSGLLGPGPWRFGSPRKDLKVLASSFHAALLELAHKVKAGEVLACEYCGLSFVAERPRRARYCSPQCRALAKKARDRGHI